MEEIELSEEEKSEYINELRFISAIILLLFGVTMVLSIRYLEYKHEITCATRGFTRAELSDRYPKQCDIQK